MPSHTVIDRPGVTIQPPADPELARLWELAHAKVETALGDPPATHGEWNHVTTEYGRLLSKARGSLGAVVGRLQEYCSEVGNNGD